MWIYLLLIGFLGRTAEGWTGVFQSQNLANYYIHFDGSDKGYIAQGKSQAALLTEVPGVTGEEGAVSFHSASQTNLYVHDRDGYLYLDELTTELTEFTFYLRDSLYYDGYSSFESVVSANHFIRHQSLELKMHDYDNTELFQKDSSYLKISECEPNPCQNGGTCVAAVESYTCTCSSDYTGTHCETAGEDFLYWTESFTGQSCPWDSSLTTCAKCKTGGVQCPYHTTPNVCVMDGEYSQNKFCCHSLGLYSTCDNEMWLFANGEEIGHLNDWSLSIFRQITSDVTVVAIECLDWSGNAGILASFSDGTTSDTTSWSCSTVATDGWTDPAFVEDSDWETPESLGTHPVGPWGTVAGMSNAAHWIWYPGQTRNSPGPRTVYCRTNLAWAQLESCKDQVDEAVGTMPPTTTTTTTPLPTTTTTPPTTTTTTPPTTTTTPPTTSTTPPTTTTTTAPSTSSTPGSTAGQTTAAPDSSGNNVVGDTGAQSQDQEEDKGVNAGALGGGVAGGVAAAAAGGAGLLYAALRKKKKKNPEEGAEEGGAPEETETRANSVPPANAKPAW